MTLEMALLSRLAHSPIITKRTSMPPKVLCISTNNEADLEAARSFEIRLGPHDSQRGSFWIGRTDMPRGQLCCFSRDQPLTTFYISDNKNTVYVSLPEEHLLYSVVENMQTRLKAINPDIKNILRGRAAYLDKAAAPRSFPSRRCRPQE